MGTSLLPGPCAGMKAAMMSANVGDDVFRDDPSVLRYISDVYYC